MRKFQGETLVVATHNEGKLDEVRALFANKSMEILSSKSLPLVEPQLPPKHPQQDFWS